MNGILVVDKPSGPTSHDVVAMLRRGLGTRAVGHAGTLDPAATGVLVVAVGEGTKLVQYLTADHKEYETVVALGTSTSTGDAAGDVVAQMPVPEGLARERVERALAGFVGVHPQRVPRVSAVKVGGERLYAKARRGEEFEAPVRDVELRRAEVLGVTPTSVTVRLEVSKGFYVRSFGEALGEVLGTAAHLSALRRTRSGAFGLEDAVTFEQISAARAGDEVARQRLRGALLPLEKAWGNRPRITLTDAEVVNARAGRLVRASGPESAAGGDAGEDPAQGEVSGAFDSEGRLVALLSPAADAPGAFRVVRGINPAPISGDDAPRGAP
jgi:tRNA pseudouridine55 synthase